VVSLLDVFHLMLNTRVGGVVALRWEEEQSMVFLSWFPFSPARQGWFPRGGSHGGFRGGSFDRRDDMVAPTLEQMARHWFYSFGPNHNAESFVHSHAHF
jgi:hypothetical protein